MITGREGRTLSVYEKGKPTLPFEEEPYENMNMINLKIQSRHITFFLFGKHSEGVSNLNCNQSI